MRSFTRGRGALRAAITTARAALRRTVAARNRLAVTQARRDLRDWQMKRRDRTHQLIELGGLVAKAGLIEATDDDRAVIFGALVEIAARLQSDDAAQLILRWRRRGQRAFADMAQAQRETGARC